MGLVENIKAECTKKGVRISQIEKELGFSNGYISKLKRETVPAERLYKMAEYFKVSPEYLLTGKEPVQTAESVVVQELLDAADGCAPEDIHLASDMLRRLKAYNRMVGGKNTL